MCQYVAEDRTVSSLMCQYVAEDRAVSCVNM
jgi:hypothetical protein